MFRKKYKKITAIKCIRNSTNPDMKTTFLPLCSLCQINSLLLINDFEN